MNKFKKKEFHIFYLFNIHDLLITKSIVNQYLANKDIKIFFMGEKNKEHFEWLGNINDKIQYMDDTNFYSRIKFFNLIKKEVANNNHKEIFFYASTYVNFVSNYFFRKKVNKVLLSHGISNYVKAGEDFNSRTYANTHFKIFDIINIYYYHYLTVFKQFIQLLVAGHIYDINYSHSSNFNRINFDSGYFFSLQNLVTKTKNDKVVKIEFENKNLPQEDYILYLEELHSPVNKNIVVEKLIINYLRQYPNKIIIHKPHPNMTNNQINKLKIKNKVILASNSIPAEYYINKNVKVSVIGCLSSTLIYSKLINHHNEALYFDDQPANTPHANVLNNFNIKTNKIITNRTYYNTSEYFTYSPSYLRKAVRNIKDILTIKSYSYDSVKNYFHNKSGMEIGGPSRIFQNLFPVYKDVNSITNINFSTQTFWEGEIIDGKNFRYFGNKIGNQFILEATNLNKLKKDQFDFVISSHTLEHIANPIKAVLEWKRVVKKGGCIFLILPNKKNNFDHRREYTTFDHILNDFKNNTQESDLFHVKEILEKHDLKKDLPAGNFENFKIRSYDNLNNRHLHHHVFSEKLLRKIFEYCEINIIQYTFDKNNLIIAGIK